jgi:hypothetical protein
MKNLGAVFIFAWVLIGLNGPAEAVAAVANVQECHNYSATNSATLTCTFGVNVTGTNLVACFATQAATTTNTATFSDTAGNTYTNRSYYADTSTTARGIASYAKNVTGGFTVVTVTWSSSLNSARYLTCQEISGADTSAPDDGAVGQFQLDVTSTATDAITSSAIRRQRMETIFLEPLSTRVVTV